MAVHQLRAPHLPKCQIRAPELQWEALPEPQVLLTDEIKFREEKNRSIFLLRILILLSLLHELPFY
jgi:hypothetical protein